MRILVKITVLLASVPLLFWALSACDAPEPSFDGGAVAGGAVDDGAGADGAVDDGAADSGAVRDGAVDGVQDAAPYYVVAEYDETRDPALDLETAVARARDEGKRILVEVGGEWCGWCKRLDLYIHDHPAISHGLEEGFLIVKVNFSREDENEEFLGQYPDIKGYPHIFVLESDGTLLHSQNTGDLEEGSSYNEEALLTFLNAWTPGGAGA
jgi:thioredoxin-related protein